MKTMLESRYNKQSLVFFLVGLATVAFDYSSYWSLVNLGVSPILAKGIGFLVGAAFAYIANSRFTFDVAVSLERIPRFSLLYLVTLALNILSNHIVLNIYGSSVVVMNVAFVVAVSLSATTNFLGMKYWVYKV